MDLYEKTACVAAQWWADRLDSSLKDKARLFASLREMAVERLRAGEHVMIEFDYDPKGILNDACVWLERRSQRMFPQKHYTLLASGEHLGTIKVKEGYAEFRPDIIVKLDQPCEGLPENCFVIEQSEGCSGVTQQTVKCISIDASAPRGLESTELTRPVFWNTQHPEGEDE